jgi:aspartate/methionine/tyrosine aminotransferase
LFALILKLSVWQQSNAMTNYKAPNFWSDRLMDAKKRLGARSLAAAQSSVLLPSHNFPHIISLFEGSGIMRSWSGVAKAVSAALHDLDLFEPEAYYFQQVRPALLEEVKNFFSVTCKISWVNDQHICIGHGVSHLFDALLSHAVSPGDLVITTAPFYHSFAEFPNKWGACLEVIPTSRQMGFKLTKSDLLSFCSNHPRRSHIKMLVLTNPSTSGAVYSISELSELAEAINELKLPVFVDEIFRDHTYSTEPFTSLGSLPGMERWTVTAHSGSKTRGAADYRIGWACGPEHLISKMIHYSEYSVTNISSLSQIAGVEILKTPSEYLEIGRRECLARIKLLMELTAQMNARLSNAWMMVERNPISPLCNVEGGHNMILDLNCLAGLILPNGKPLQTSLDLCEHLMTPDTASLSAADCVAFSPCYSSGLNGMYVRLSFAEVGHQYVSALLANKNDFVIAQNCLLQSPCGSCDMCACNLEAGFSRGRELLIEAFRRLECRMQDIFSYNAERDAVRSIELSNVSA